MEDKKNILSDINFLDSPWLEERDIACNTVLYVYYKISERFSKDEKYGPKFVKDNQQLIGVLVQAAMSELESINKKDIVADLIKAINNSADNLSNSLSNISYTLEDKKNQF